MIYYLEDYLKVNEFSRVVDKDSGKGWLIDLSCMLLIGTVKNDD